MSKPVVFVSYSHNDYIEKKRVLRQLQVLSDKFDAVAWTDDFIRAGANWREQIFQAIDTATLAILLITDNFLTSDFIKNVELPRLFERQKRDGMIIIPLIVRHCAWDQVEWLEAMQVRPSGGGPVWASGNLVDQVLADFAKEVGGIIKGKHPAAMTGPSRARSPFPFRKPMLYVLSMLVLFLMLWFYLVGLMLVSISEDMPVGPVNASLSSRKYISPNEEQEFLLDDINLADWNIQTAFQLINQSPFKCYFYPGNFFCNGVKPKNSPLYHRLIVIYAWKMSDGWGMFNQPAGLSLSGHAGNMSDTKQLDIFIAPVPYMSKVIILLMLIWAGLSFFLARGIAKYATPR